MDNATLDRIIDHYGRGHQIDKAVEELGELIVAIAKERGAQKLRQVDSRHRADVIEEIADAKVTIAQLEIIYSCREEVERMMNYKIQRTLEEVAKDA